MSEPAIHGREETAMTLARETLRAFGEVRSVVRGASMVPTMFPGDVAVVRREADRTPRLGDVMLFVRNGFFCAHRLVEHTFVDGSACLIARGDALDKNDPPFAESELLGRVTAVIRRGKRIEIDEMDSAAGRRVLRWVVQRSGGSVKWLLRFDSLRTRLFPPSASAGERMECRPEGAV